MRHKLFQRRRFLSPTVQKKSISAKEKFNCYPKYTLEYSDELELSSTFLEQWTLDASGVLRNLKKKMESKTKYCR